MYSMLRVRCYLALNPSTPALWQATGADGWEPAFRQTDTQIKWLAGDQTAEWKTLWWSQPASPNNCASKTEKYGEVGRKSGEISAAVHRVSFIFFRDPHPFLPESVSGSLRFTFTWFPLPHSGFLCFLRYFLPLHCLLFTSHLSRLPARQTEAALVASEAWLCDNEAWCSGGGEVSLATVHIFLLPGTQCWDGAAPPCQVIFSSGCSFLTWKIT